MPYDSPSPTPRPDPGFRAAVLDLLSRGETRDEAQLRTALRALTVTSRTETDTLRDRYGCGLADRRGRVFHRYGY